MGSIAKGTPHSPVRITVNKQRKRLLPRPSVGLELSASCGLISGVWCIPPLQVNQLTSSL